MKKAHVLSAYAVLISREKLFDPASRDVLLKIIDSQKILLVYGASPTDIRQELNLEMPTAKTETTRYVVGAAFRFALTQPLPLSSEPALSASPQSVQENS